MKMRSGWSLALVSLLHAWDVSGWNPKMCKNLSRSGAFKEQLLLRFGTKKECANIRVISSQAAIHQSTTSDTSDTVVESEQTSELSSPEGITTIIAPQHSKKETPECPYPSLLHSIHIQPILTDDEAATVFRLAKEYAAETKRWQEPDFERHSTYATVDFPIDECEPVAGYLGDIDFEGRLFEKLSEAYGIPMEDMSYLDFFCANYEAKAKDEDESSSRLTIMDELEFHRDGSLLSFTVLLSPPESFEGGGTIFDTLRDVSPATPEQSDILQPNNGVIRLQRAGDCVIHSGKILHGGYKVTSGQRTVLVGFVDVADWCQRPGVLGEACREFGRMDVALYWKKRQDKMTENGKRKGWKLHNSRWLSRRSADGVAGRTYLSYSPFFSSVVKRAEPEYQRRKRLEAEDILLRRILLPEEERVISLEPLDDLDGDITVL